MHLACELGLLKDAEQVFLRAAGLREDDGLLLQRGALLLLGLRSGRKASPKRREEHLALGVLDDGLGEGMELAELRHFLPQFG